MSYTWFVLLLFLGLWSVPSWCEYVTSPATGNCESFSTVGQSIYCCDGACYDGTNIHTGTGLCGGFDDACTDPLVPITCAYNQVYSSPYGTSIDAGLGSCYLPALSNCQWESFNYTWTCCDCPLGYTAVATSCSEPYGYCATCTGPDEQLTYQNSAYECIVISTTMTVSTATSSLSTSSMTTDTATTSTTMTSSATISSTSSSTLSSPMSSTESSSTDTGTTSETSAQATTTSVTTSVTTSTTTETTTTRTSSATACPSAVQHFLDEGKQITSDFSTFSSWAGAFCPTTDLLSGAASALEDIYGIFKAYKNPTHGVTGTLFGAASGFLATVSSVTIGAAVLFGGVDLAGAGAVAEAFVAVGKALCAANTAAGGALTAYDAALNAYLTTECGENVSKRSIKDFDADLVFPLSSRTASFTNPCSEFSSYVPEDRSAPFKILDACFRLDEVEPINAASLNSAIEGMRSFCDNYQRSGQAALNIAFVDMIAAIEAAEPYCTPALSTLTSTSISPSSSSTSMRSSTLTTATTSRQSTQVYPSSVMTSKKNSASRSTFSFSSFGNKLSVAAAGSSSSIALTSSSSSIGLGVLNN